MRYIFSRFALLFACAHVALQAQTVFIDMAADGNWHDPGNWSAGVPNSGLNADLTGYNTVAYIYFGNASAATLNVGNASGAELHNESGYLLTSSFAFVGGASSNYGTVYVTGGSTWAAGTELFIGDNGHGDVHVQGGTLSAGLVELGWNAGATGSLDLISSTLTANGLLIGNQGAAAVTVSGGSVLDVGSIVVWGNTGTLKLQQDNTWGNNTTSATAPILIKGGGTVTNGGNYFNALVNPALQGGTLLAEGGYDTGLYGSWMLKGTVTAYANSSSLITYTGDAVRGRIQIGDNAANGATTFGTQTGSLLTIDNIIENGRDGSDNAVASRIVKTGLGVLRLNGANLYTGGTTINGGTLLANGGFTTSSSLGSGMVTVNSGGTLGGDDRITGLVAVNSGGFLEPGDSLGGYGGVLRFDGGLTLNDGAALNFHLSDSSLHFLTMGNGSVLTGPSSGTVAINFYDFGDFAAGSYTLIDFSAAGVTTSSFDLADFYVGDEIDGYSFVLNLTGNTLEVTATAVPEPSTYAVLFGAGALGLAMWRRLVRRSLGEGGRRVVA